MSIVEEVAVAHESDRLSDAGMARRGASSPTRLLARRFLHHRTGMVGLGMLAFVVAVAVFAPLLATHDPSAQSDLINHFGHQVRVIRGCGGGQLAVGVIGGTVAHAALERRAPSA